MLVPFSIGTGIVIASTLKLKETLISSSVSAMLVQSDVYTGMTTATIEISARVSLVVL